VQLLRHQQVRALEYTLGDPECDRVDEETLPQLERGRRRLLQPRKVDEVAPERLPALGFGLRLGSPLAPHRHRSNRGQHDDCVHERADAERKQQHGRPRREDRVVAVASDREQDQPRDRERRRPQHERAEPGVRKPIPLSNRGTDVVLELLEPLRVLNTVVLDPVAEAGEPLGPIADHVVHDACDCFLEGLELLLRALRELEVRHVLGAEPAPDGALGRDGCRRVHAAPDQVEERRRELVRADGAALCDERRHERRLELRRRLLLVLAVVAGVVLPPEPAVDPEEDDCSGDEGEHQQAEPRPQRVPLRVVDPLAVALGCVRSADLLADDPVEAGPTDDPHAVGGRERAAREQRPELDPLSGRHIDSTQHDAVRLEPNVAADRHRVTPGAKDRTRREEQRIQLTEADLPLVAPDPEVDVDDVVVGDCEPTQPVMNAKRARLRVGAVVPDDAKPPVGARRAERSGRARGAELGRRARRVVHVPLGDADLVDRLLVAERQLAEAAGEGAVEEEGDVLVDDQRAVIGRLDDDVAERKRETLRRRRRRSRERDRNGDGQNCTRGASRAGSSISKNGLLSKLNQPATRFVGTVWRAFSYVSTVSL
jgi:hypothetical protein